MDGLIYILIGVAIGFIWGWMSHTKAMLERLLKDPDEFFKKLMEYRNMIVNDKEDAPKSEARDIRVDQENGIYYLYAEDNGQFLAQGKTLEDAFEKLTDRFPGQKFAGLISKEEAERLGIS